MMQDSNTDVVVFISGHFNVIHPGHLRLFRFAKECGNRLIIGVESDRIGGHSVHVPQHLRLEGVLSNTFVDDAFIFDEDIGAVIERNRPNIVVKGKEHELLENKEARALQSYGGKLLFSSGETAFSSLDLIRREFSELDVGTIKLPNEYLNRNNVKHARLRELVERFRQLNLVVIGDLIVDEYITCQPLGMSQEDPTIVVRPIDSISFLGGAGIVAAHGAGLGAKVDFFSVTGLDVSSQFSRNKLKEFQVNAYLFTDESRPTTLKKRYRSNGKSLLRVSHLHQDAISSELQKKMLDQLRPKIKNADLLVFSDFNYGCLPQALVQEIIYMCKESGVFLAADSQSSSQVGDISRFIGLDLITPTEREARIATRNQEDGLVVMAEKLRIQAKAKNIFLKLGEEGMLIHACAGDKNIMTDQLPALNSHPKDVAGAGDSLLVIAAMALASGANIWEAGCLGSLAAAIQVGRVGNTPLKISELVAEI
jgi:rfaE bifunctional protein kinase chain/domain